MEAGFELDRREWPSMVLDRRELASEMGLYCPLEGLLSSRKRLENSRTVPVLWRLRPDRRKNPVPRL